VGAFDLRVTCRREMCEEPIDKIAQVLRREMPRHQNPAVVICRLGDGRSPEWFIRLDRWPYCVPAIVATLEQGQARG
jgi:hypothetical protein